MPDEQLTQYIKKGLERGFRLEYIRDTLIGHSYTAAQVDSAITQLRAFEPGTITYEKPPVQNSQKSMARMLGAIIVVLIIILFFAILNTKKTYEDSKKIAQLDLERQKLITEQVSKIEFMSSNIDQKQTALSENIQKIKELKGDVETKERLLTEQAEQLQQLNEEIREERENLKLLLLDLMNSILERSSEEEAD